MRLLGRLRGIDVFVATANAGSFGAASRSLCLTESAVRKAIARLKERLDTQLFKRLPQNLELTKTGARFHRHCARAKKEMEKTQASILESPSLRGTSLPLPAAAEAMAQRLAGP